MSSYIFLKLLRKKRNVKLSQKERQNSQSPSNSVHGDNICRICLKEGYQYIFSSKNTFNIQDAIKTITGIEICETDSYPKCVCSNCFALLQGAVTFRNTAIDSDKLLHQAVTADFQIDNANDEDSNQSEEMPLVAYKEKKKLRIQCNLCKAIIRSDSYQKHLMRHQSATHLVCEVCGKLYRKDNLIRHLQLHSDYLPHVCQICPYRGRFYESLKIHLRTHSGDKPFSCDKCSLRFLTRSNLNRHLLTHKKEKPFKCLECSRSFYLKRDMEAHFKADHTGVKDFVCDACGNKYGTKKALMRHELRVHKRDKMTKGRTPLYLLNNRKCNGVQ